MYVENVVNPPSIPTPRKGRTRRWACPASVTSTISTPISRHPDTLIQNVVHAKLPAGWGKTVASPKRVGGPSPPPAEIAASVDQGTSGDRGPAWCSTSRVESAVVNRPSYQADHEY